MKAKYPLATLYALLFLLNILDYLTTVYCLENIPNAYEANPWIKTPEAIFRFKILYGIPVGIAGILIGFAFDWFRMKFRSRIVYFCYFVLFAFTFAVFIHYVVTVASNIDIILRYG